MSDGIHTYISEGRNALTNYYKKKAFLSFYYGIFSYIRYFKYYIKRNDVALFNLFIRYTVHDYKVALKIRNSFNKRRLFKGALNIIDELFGDIKNKEVQKNFIISNKKNYKRKNILFIFGETEEENVLLWQKGLYNLAFESAIRDGDPEEKDDYFRSETINHNFIRIDTINFSDEIELLNHLPLNPDLIFIVSHGDLKETPSFKMKFGNSFPPSEPKIINMSSFCKQLKNKIKTEDCILICFACGSKRIENTGFKNLVLCGDNLTYLPLISYSFSFLSSFNFDDTFSLMHKRAKLITELFTEFHNVIID